MNFWTIGCADSYLTAQARAGKNAMRPPFAHRSAVPASFTASPQQRGLNSMDDELRLED